VDENLTLASTTESPESMAEAVGAPVPEQTSEEQAIAQERVENGNGRRSGKGVEKRIDRLVKERETLREENEQLRQQLANGNGHDHGQPSTVTAEPTRSEPDPKIAALRDRYPDWDEQMTRAARENLRIPDEAARAMHAMPNGGHIAYLLVTQPEFREHLNRMPPAQAAKEIARLDNDIAINENGGNAFAEQVRSALSSSELAEVTQAIKSNPIGSQLVYSTMRELSSLPNGPQVFRELIKDSATCARLATMNQQSVAVELGRISARLEANANRVVVSQAPKPMKPLGGGNVRHSVDLNDPQLDYREFRRVRDAQERAFNSGSDPSRYTTVST